MSPSNLCKILALLGLAPAVVTSIDISLDKVTCDRSLPIYAFEDGIKMQCDQESRCTFGEEAVLSGRLYYDGFEEAGMQANNETETGITGYATADLQLMTLNYKLFSDMAVKLCGDWIYSAQDGNNDCPNDGIYHFETIYKLPESTDYKTWFATGWKGTSTIAIRSERSAYDGSELGSLLGYCELHFSTYTTQTDSDEFKTLPSAMVVTISLAAAAALFSMCACYLACCRKGRPIAVDEPPSEEADQYQKMEDGGMVSQKIKRSKQEKDYFDPIAMSRSQEK